MDSMQEFWACRWLLTNIGKTYKTQEILKAIEIAQTEGYISKDGHITAAGKSYVEQNKEVFSLVEYNDSAINLKYDGIDKTSKLNSMLNLYLALHPNS